MRGLVPVFVQHHTHSGCQSGSSYYQVVGRYRGGEWIHLDEFQSYAVLTFSKMLG